MSGAEDNLSNENKRLLLSDEFEKLRKHYVKHGVNEESIKRLLIAHVRRPQDFSVLAQNQTQISFSLWNRHWKSVCGVVVLIASVFVPFVYIISDINRAIEYLENTACLLESNQYLTELSRPLFDCNTCRGITSWPVVDDISMADFKEKHAYSSVPVMVKNAAKNWSAIEVFSYEFLKDTFTKDEKIIAETMEKCQFFPYKTEFQSLGEMFEMSEARSRFEDGEENWYIGWSNCNSEVQKQLRQHYSRPYFLPEHSESSSIDWIFMGGPGDGANIHIDQVKRPSWQAQIKGKKTWSLIPPPECESVCTPFNVTMEPGDIVVVDTNEWYHSTFVHKGEISITIGTEYD